MENFRGDVKMEIIKCPACHNEITGDDIFKGKE